jgi:excisionase family DNA binding protein
MRFGRERSPLISQRMLTIQEVAELLHVHGKTVRRRINDGVLQVVRSGPVIQIHPSEMGRFIANSLSI